LQPLIEIGKIEVFQNLQASGVRFFIILWQLNITTFGATFQVINSNDAVKFFAQEIVHYKAINIGHVLNFDSIHAKVFWQQCLVMTHYIGVVPFQHTLIK
jgi:hypothetical protein